MRVDSTRRRITLFGAFGVGNLGNECTLQAFLYNLKKYIPGAEIRCICSEPMEVTSTYHFAASPIREAPLPYVKNRAIRLLRRIFVGIPTELHRWTRAFQTL